MDPNPPNAAAYFIGPDGRLINHRCRDTYMGNARAVLPDGRVFHVSDPYLWEIFHMYFDPRLRDALRFRSMLPEGYGDNLLARLSPELIGLEALTQFYVIVDPTGEPIDYTDPRLFDARIFLMDLSVSKKGRFIHVCDPYIWEIFDQYLDPEIRPFIKAAQALPISGPPPALSRARAHASVASPENENTNDWIDVAPRRRRRRASNVEGDSLGQVGQAGGSV